MSRRYAHRTSIPVLLVSALLPLVSVDAWAAPPMNDKCPGAEVIPPAGPFPHLSSVVEDLGQATTTGDPFPSCVNSFSRGIWYSFTPSATAEYRISTCSPPTATTVYDTVLAVYTSSNGTCNGSMIQIANGCGDDECDKRSAVTATLNAGTTYYIVASKWGGGAPPAGENAMQVEVTRSPANDSCENAAPLPFERTILGALTLGHNDYEVSTSAPDCYAEPAIQPPVGQQSVASSASGRDVAYTFTAPNDGEYTFRAQSTTGGADLVVHLASTCPTGAGPHTLTDCLGAANRNVNSGAYYATEEVNCVPLLAGQTVYVYVDESSPTDTGVQFSLEATACNYEFEPNDDPTMPAPLACGLAGSIFPKFDEDYFELGNQPTGTRVFAMADGAASNGVDFDMRITTLNDTLEYDDSNNSVSWGEGAPNIAGTPLTGETAQIKMSYFGNMLAAEPYHLYSVLQPPGMGLGNSSATAEVEPNDSIANATMAGNLFFSGTISVGGPAGDQDLFKFCADEGDLLYLSIDGDPLRDQTPIDPMVFLLDRAGTSVLSWSDTSNSAFGTPSPGTHYGTSPIAPAEAALYRARYTGLYYAGVRTEFEGISYGMGDYLYSIGINCTRGSQLETDLAIALSPMPDPVLSDQDLDLEVDVTNQGPRVAQNPHWKMSVPAGLSFVSIAAPPEWQCDVVGSDIDCSTTCFPHDTAATFTVKLHTAVCILPGSITHTATISSETLDKENNNDSATETTQVVDGGPCEDGDVCTVGDTCLAGACITGVPNDCNDNNVCTTEVCLPGGGCSYTNVAGSCDDGNTCTTVDSCINGECKGSVPLDCNDGDVCTDDACDPATGCYTTFNTAPCEDGNGCTTQDKCETGTCVGGPPLVCEPLNDCQEQGICDSATGNCAYFAKPDGTLCDDGNSCTTNDTCKSGTCAESTPIDCPPPPDKCHGPGTCVAATGQCEYALIGGDLDGDGDGDDCDLDIDGDGISNANEIAWGMNPWSKDSDGDTINDCTEACSKNDGSCFDGVVCNVDTPANTDNDDSIDALDSDSDNDGAADSIEAGDDDLLTPPKDSNGDGLPDYRDPRTVIEEPGGLDDVVLSGGCACSTPVGTTNESAPLGLLAGLGLLLARFRRRRS